MRRLVAVVVSVLTGLVLLAPTAGPAAAAGTSYVALGDSYSSGTGTRSYLSDGTTCQRSAYAYPSLIATRSSLALNFRACSGAKVADVSSLQLPALSSTTSYVTLTVGGNDAGFASVLTECAKPSWASNCNAAVDRAQSIIRTQLPAGLTALYKAIRTRAPQARVVVAGYPRIFNGEDCNLLTWFSPTEEARLNATADLLNSTIQAAVAGSGAGLTYSSPTARFVSHAVCDDVEWLNGLASPTSESFHPNRSGHASGYYPLVSTALTGSAPATTLSASQAAVVSEQLAVQQRRYADRDRAIQPAVVTIPDLRSPEIERAAARAGVDLRSRASIDAADRRYAWKQAQEHAARS
ncbi:SGNH/GDSL hydrolase family protein [Microlunatus capsulatus]|uniref:Lysophospholipase L1-like esterase n=1 Tax=Microlunatus capsulatus TaxID=99117 RepID=A0ABS4Z8X8_9ACTN|nr:SGNH/GDSL hydrolase family protein [Microlunatus capsulatus]MBP2417456.1 lysophospholipase L1-like esterase [Microlunatus capsulatus]